MNSQAEFQKLLLSLQRPINCLADEDRNIRKGGLDAIKKQMNTISKDYALKLFNETKLTAMLTKIINDKIQNNRQLGLQITEQLIKIAGADAKNLYEQILPSLISRLNQTPFPQKSEDLRLKIVNIFIKLVPYKDCFLKNLPELASAIAKCLADAYDEIKNAACDLTNKLSQVLSHDIGKHSANILLSLRDNLKHQKFKVRKTSLQTIGFILVTDGAGGNFEQVKVTIKSTLSDKKKEVRDAAYQSIAHLLLYLGPKYMREFEATLTGLLLMGLDDESPQTIQKVVGLLQKCGGKLKQEQGEQTQMIQQGSK